MATLREKIKMKPWLGWMLFFLTVVAVFFIGLLASNIMERRTEAQFLDRDKIDVQPFEPRNEVWGINHPKQYETYMATSDTNFVSKHNGSKKIDMLARYPSLVVLWAGYAFSKEYNQARGHYYAVKDVTDILRTGAPDENAESPMPATCWTCKSPDVPRLMNNNGVKEFYDGNWAGHGSEVVNPIGCADCHDSESMELKITRPALIEAFNRMGKDINESTHQEMRSLVCAQCHVEYYFNKEKPYKGVPYLTFPWDNGMSVEEIEAYYDAMNFSDWTHGLSKTPMIKAQHPGYELYLTGIHAKRGVACADCHMPYKSEGGVKFTDHKIQSPLNNVSNSCQVCHRQSALELTNNVNDNMDKVISVRSELEHLLVDAHIEAQFAWSKGATEEQMKDALMDIRHAQWRWDFAAASHGGAFHAPIETLRILGTGIAKAQDARLKIGTVLRKLGFDGEVPKPDLSTKELAQSYIGLDMVELNKEKAEFLKNVVPIWLEKANERESQWTQYEMAKAVKY